jgi:hypothetical protein
MATTTYEPIQSQTLSSASATVTFLDIPQGYTDLILIANRRYSNVITGADNTFIRFNNDSGANYSSTAFINGPNTTRINNANSLYTSAGGNEIAERFSVDVWNFFNYSNTNTYKSSLLDYNFGASHKQFWAGSWRSTAAITRIDIIGGGSGTFASGSIFTLYGIANAAVATGVKATGGIITYDDTYYYHTFGASGTFTPKQSLTADYLVVAGGGGGAGNQGGGGGAGGLRSTVTATGGGGSLESVLSLTGGTAYTVTVGAGGVGTWGGITNGSNSVFSTITSTGGGKGGNGGVNGSSGGSGGGGGYAGSPPVGTGGAGTANQGFAGGDGVLNQYGGSGGGAGGVGTAGNNASITGGAGIATSISSSSVTYATGGNNNGSGNGTTNTGNGAQANENNGANNGGNGGSGIVIVRYTKA